MATTHLVLKALAILLLPTYLLAASRKTSAVPFTVKESATLLNISFGELVVSLSKSPWHVTVVDAATGSPLLAESSDEKHRMGFGRWDGVYLNQIYEGYLLRVGVTVEWYHSTDIISWTNTSNDVIVTVATSDSRGRSLRVNFTGFQERQFAMHSAVQGNDTDNSNRVAIGFLSPDEDSEGFYGFGERFTGCNQRGHEVGSWLEDGSWGLGVFDPAAWKLRVPKGEESTYCPMPILLSTKGYALQMDTFYRTVYDLAKETDGIVKLEQETNTLNITFMMTDNPLDAFYKIVEHNGKSLIPPPWEFSPWNQLTSEVPNTSGPQRIIDFFFKYDIPCSHDVNTVHFFPDGGQRGNEAKLKADNEALLALGVKSTAYFNAMLGRDYTELYDPAATNGYLLKTQDGKPYNYTYIGAGSFKVSQVDFSNPAAMKWYQEQLQSAVDLKFSGWMYDYGEYTPPDSVAFDGSTGLKMHNEFSLLYQKTAFDFFRSLDPDPTDDYAPDYIFYVRSCYAGSQRYTWAHWTGDPSSDWSYASGLPAQIVASLNIGMSGMPYSGSDIGGFEWYVDPPPDLELWARWTAAGCVSGLMHEQGGGKGEGSKTHIFDFENGTAIWRKFAKLRMQLFPYIYTQAHIARETGLPIMRHHLLTFWNDSTAIAQCQQYMFGESFLAAPVVDEGSTDWDVYLPAYKNIPGPQWMDVGSTFQYDTSDGRFRIGFSGYLEGGKTVKVEAPLDTIPLFVLAGSVVPVLDPTVQTLNNATNSSVITWFRKKDLRYVWVFADQDFSARGTTWDGLEYELRQQSSASHHTGSATVSASLVFSVSGAPKTSVHIPQIVGPWQSAGYPSNVSGTEPLQSYPTWRDLLAGSSGGYSFDKQQQALWIKLLRSDSASIILG